VVKIRLKRFGTVRKPCYRIVVQDVRQPRDGTTIEEVGTYQPIAGKDKQVLFNADRIRYWIGVGAQPTDVVRKILNNNGFTK
jgi:small subunit ribosomal protein S16